jgi:hypothetical protein
VGPLMVRDCVGCLDGVGVMLVVGSRGAVA